MVAGKSDNMLKVLSFWDRDRVKLLSIKITFLIFFLEKSTMKHTRGSSL